MATKVVRREPDHDLLALLTDALIAAGARAWTHTVWSSAGLVTAVLTFSMLERRSPAPVINQVLLRSARVRAGLLAAAIANFTLAGALFVLPLLLQRERHLSALDAGLAFLPLTVPFAANPPLTGKIVARTGPRRPILAGLALLTAGSTVLARTVLAEGAYHWLALGLLLTGFGISSVLPALVAAIISAAPSGTTGAAGGLLNAVRQVGATLGAALMGAAAAADTGWLLLLSAGVCALAWLAFALTHPSAPPQ
ncbi:MFS transporter [Streptomyces sp. NPDC051064]|uniref:MFS transporter n=1 Tax=Streptomyces sp. NPDC051064 TaxID=3365641 RepID=UPI00379F346D